MGNRLLSEKELYGHEEGTALMVAICTTSESVVSPSSNIHSTGRFNRGLRWRGKPFPGSAGRDKWSLRNQSYLPANLWEVPDSIFVPLREYVQIWETSFEDALSIDDSNVFPVSEVEKYVEENKLEVYLQLSHTKIDLVFPRVDNLKTVLSGDPESGEQWLSVRFETEGTLNQIGEAWEKYLDYWIAEVPSQSRSKIRLLYDIL